MELSKIRETIQAVTSDVLETMFFQVIDVSDSQKTIDEWLPQDRHLLRAALDFSGFGDGSFYLVIPESAAALITANFLGLELEEIENGQREDTVREILNMIGGGTLSQIDEEGAFRLGMPRLVDDHAFKSRTGGLHEEVLLFETEHSRLAVAVVVRPGGKGGEK